MMRTERLVCLKDKMIKMLQKNTIKLNMMMMLIMKMLLLMIINS